VVRGANREDVRKVVRRRVRRHRVRVHRVVARGRHEERVGRGDGVVECLILGTAAPRVAHDVGAHHVGVVDRLDGGFRASVAVRAEELHRHDADVPRHTRDADTVVAHAADGARAVGAVTVVVHRIAVVVEEVVAVNVVNVTVAVIVHAIARDLAGIGPYVLREVGVVVVDACIDDRDHNVGRPGLDVPRRGGVDVGIGIPAALAGVVHPPQILEARIVGDRARRVDVVGLRVRHAWHHREGGDSLFHRHAGRKPDDLEATHAVQGATAHRTDHRACHGLRGLARGVAVAHEHLTLEVRVPRSRRRNTPCRDRWLGARL